MWRWLTSTVSKVVKAMADSLWSSLPRSQTIIAVPGIERYGDEFICALVEVAHNLGIDPDWLATVMSFESGVKSDQPNIWCVQNKDCAPDCCAVGLIQFMPSTAELLGTSTPELRRMSAVDQLSYVERFYWPYRGQLDEVGDLYMATFLPAGLNEPDELVVGREGDFTHLWGLEMHKIYVQNAGFDVNDDREITVGEIKTQIRDFYTRHLAAPRLPYECLAATSVRREVPAGGSIGIGGGVVAALVVGAAMLIGRARS